MKKENRFWWISVHHFILKDEYIVWGKTHINLRNKMIDKKLLINRVFCEKNCSTVKLWNIFLINYHENVKWTFTTFPRINYIIEGQGASHYVSLLTFINFM